jgi:hypothetical protein
MDYSSVRPQQPYSHLLNALNALTPTFIISGLYRVCYWYTLMTNNQTKCHCVQR